MKIGLVLEGGAMRGAYTVGVLDYLMDNNIQVDYAIGVSAGASNGVSYVSNQRGRGLRITTNYIGDKRYVSFSNFLKTKSLFGMDFIFGEIPTKLDPFDYDVFLSSPCDFKVGATNVVTGETEYFCKDDMNYDCTVLRASSSIPIFSPIVEYKGEKYLDGGTSDPIPARKAIEDGCDKLIIVLTREKGYVKGAEKFKALYKFLFRKYPKMIGVLDNRHKIYNESLKYIYELEEKGDAIIIAPEYSLGVNRFEKDKGKLQGVYNKGIEDAGKVADRILNLLNKN